VAASDGFVLNTVAARGVSLCHFDGLTPLNWALKMVRYDERNKYPKGMPRNNQHRYHQVAFVAANKGSPEAVGELHDALKVVPKGARAEQLVKAKHLRAHHVDPAEALARVAPDLSVDLSVGRFDTWLRANRPHLTEFIDAFTALPA
jgi:hypothetical protein